MNSSTIKWLVPALLAAAVLTGLLSTAVASANNNLPPECSAQAPTLNQAKTNYANNCSLPRIDCDRIDQTWYCSSRVIGSAAPGGVTAQDVGASAIGTITVTNPPTTQPPTTQPAVTEPPATEPAVTEPTVAEPPTTEPPTTEPTTTQPPTTQAPTTEPPATTEPPTTEPPATEPPTTQPATTQAPPVEVNCGVVAIEAESLGSAGAWRIVQDNKASGGRYLTWEGLSPSKNNNSPADVLSTTVAITKPGSYRFTWAMRQPDGVDSDKANDSWLNFPDATRFGPTGGGSYPGFIKVFGNSKGDFAYKGTADVNHNKSTIAIEFNQAGTYTLEIAGRSHGHQIDRIVLHHESISKADAIATPNGGCGETAPPSTTPTPTTATTTPAPPSSDCAANTSGEADLAKDLISLHYDHAPDRDDAHAAAAGREVSSKLGFAPWVIGGAYGADNKNSYRPATEPVMDAIWGSDGWINADDDWQQAVTSTADRWQQTLERCGDVWIAEGGQSDLSADIVRELKRRMPNLDTNRRIHLVQHSNWNEDKALDADLQYVKDNTDYIRIPDGNSGGNGTADFNDQNYNGPMVDLALNGPHAAGWRAAFDYYSPQKARLDFSDTVELLEILDINTDQVNTIEDFADLFMR